MVKTLNFRTGLDVTVTTFIFYIVYVLALDSPGGLKRYCLWVIKGYVEEVLISNTANELKITIQWLQIKRKKLNI